MPMVPKLRSLGVISRTASAPVPASTTSLYGVVGLEMENSARPEYEAAASGEKPTAKVAEVPPAIRRDITSPSGSENSGAVTPEIRRTPVTKQSLRPVLRTSKARRELRPRSTTPKFSAWGAIS